MISHISASIASEGGSGGWFDIGGVFLGLELVSAAGGLVVDLLGASGSSCMGSGGACMFQMIKVVAFGFEVIIDPFGGGC